MPTAVFFVHDFCKGACDQPFSIKPRYRYIPFSFYTVVPFFSFGDRLAFNGNYVRLKRVKRWIIYNDHTVGFRQTDSRDSCSTG
ncbi:MAG: hypothetical protein IJK98_08390, partial [Clostridia bacterium]|nr:hypothetical protein [Clostridia bacterium]